MRRNEESSQEEHEIASPEEGVWVPEVADKVSNRIRFHSIIVGESKSVRVGPLSSSFLCAHDWGNSLVTKCLAGCLLS